MANVPTLDEQRSWWNQWDQAHLHSLSSQCVRRGDVVLSLVTSLNLNRPSILEVGCANGWLCARLVEFGAVTGVDLADEAIREAQNRIPNASFIAGDFCSLGLASRFDVVVTIGTLSSVLDQKRFILGLANALRNGGYLILVTPNKTICSLRSDITPLEPGQIRRWTTRSETRQLLAPHFRVQKMFTIEPGGDRGFMRLVSSRRLNRLASRLIPRITLDSWKERLGFGQTIVALGQRVPRS